MSFVLIAKLGRNEGLLTNSFAKIYFTLHYSRSVIRLFIVFLGMQGVNMSCEFISELRRLSKFSVEAVQNIEYFDPLKEYMHITRHTETDFRQLLIKIAEVNHKQLVLVCGSAGDGKSHLLSYLKYSDKDKILDSYAIINDATESNAPNHTAIETLAERISGFRDDRLDDGGHEKVVLAINLGMLNNFIDSEQGKHFDKLKKYILKNNIFSIAQPLPFNKDEVFHHIDFSNYQLYTLTADGAKSDYLTQLFEKVFGNNTSNPFYNTYVKGISCPHHTQCPVRHNFEFLMKEDVRELLIQRIIEVCIKDKLVVTSRDVLNFIFDAVVSPDFDEKKFWDILSNPAEFLKTYISYTTPMLIFENRGTSSLIDCMTENATSNDNIKNRDEKVLNFYAEDDIIPIVSSVLNGSKYLDGLLRNGFSVFDDIEESLKKDVYKFLMNYEKLSDIQILKADQLYLSFVRDLYYSYAGNIKNLKNLYKSVKNSIYSWNGIYGTDLICIDDSSDDYSILEQLNIKPDVLLGSGEKEILQFLPVIMVRFSNEAKTEKVSFSIDYSLYRVIMAMKDGYCPTSQDRNIHADFSSGIMTLSEFGTKKSRVYIVSKRKKSNMKFLFEESEFGYSFKEV